jgi:hypothetical protein
MGELLLSKNITGFIKYICLFSCYDNSTIQAKKETNIQICNAEHIPANKKDVLVMPFIRNGSIENHHWTV